ncbi:MAG TPA: phosphatidate cytidylyltransferase [Gemmatimonadales bacterium]|nr:phosphatidate cytidylyltransferase [Gemmatimonadales bacterium]
MDSNLVRRLAVAAVGIPVALGIAYWGGLPLVVLLAAAGVLGVRELFGFAERQGVRPIAVLGYATATAFAPAAYAAQTSPMFAGWARDAWPFAGAVWLLGLLTWALAARRPTERPLAAAAVTMLAVVYAGALPAFLIPIRHDVFGPRSWAGAWLVFFPLVVTWVCDSFAMFGGKTFGGPKLAPTVSPGKTRSGSVAGVVGALLVAVIFSLGVFPNVGVDASLGDLLIIAAVLSVVGQAGDLAESLFKREAGVKDSGTLIPGHGGVLDRLDSLYFVIPVAAALYRALGIT